MDLINNRYRILKNIKQNRLQSSYLALDMKRGHAAVQLNIINSEYFPEALLNFYNTEFKTLTTIQDPNIIRLYDFGLIQLIDNKKMDNNQYYYTNENIEENVNFIQLVSNMNEEDILNLFIDICKSINYLHLRGFVYGDINTDNIYVCNSHIKFKDIASIELEKYDYWSPKNSQIIFKAPEVLIGGNINIASDIYSLGVLLLTLCKKEIDDSLNISREISRLKNLKEPYSIRTLNYKQFLIDLVPIIQKMTEKSVNKRYKNLREVVEDINRIFVRDYRSHRQEQLEKLNFNTKIVGRDYEINNVVNAYNSMVNAGANEKYIIVHGEYGIGKTKLLKELKHLFVLRNVNVYSDFTLENSNVSKGKAFYEILRKIIGECDVETLDRYELELAKLIPEFGEKKRITPLEPLTGEKEKIRVLNGICGFINDFLRGKPAVFIIDNIHMASDFSIEILEYMYLRSRNIMFIFSYCDGEFTDNKKLVEFLSKIAGNINVVDVPLRGLDSDNAILMIQDILRMPKKPAGFGRSISSKTYGNPLFIEETVKNFFSEKIIYVDQLTGVWNSKYDYDYDKLPIPSNMEQAVLSQIKDIDALSNEILKILSIFNTGTTIDNICRMLQRDTDEILESTNNLEAKGILCRKIEDRGFVYDFSNRILKNLINEKLDDEYKKAKHEVASALLERQYEEGRENREELIYHLEKSGLKEKVIRYCLENADRMEAFKNRSEAIKNLEKAITMLDNTNTGIRKIELLLRVGSIYELDSNLSKAIKYYEEAEILSEKQANYKLLVEVLNRLANVYFRRNDIEKTVAYISKSEEILYNPVFLGQYTEGYLECRQIQVRVFSLKQDYEKAEDICKKCIKLCGDSYYKLKGLFHKNLGNIYVETSKIDQALENYKKSMYCFEKINFAEGIVIALNNIAVVYGDFYQDNEMMINYMLRMKEISERNHTINDEVIALTNLACSYYNKWQYENALKNLQEALEKAKKIEFETNIFYCYNYLSSIYLRLDNFKEAYECHLHAKQELEDYPEHGKDIAVYYQMGAELFYTFGDLEKAREFVNRTLEIYKNDELLSKWDSQILSEYIEIQSKNSEVHILENLSNIKNTINFFKAPLKRLEILYDTAIILYLKGFKAAALKFINDAKKIKVDFKPSSIETKSLYLKGVLGKGNNKLKFLNNALEIAKRENERSFHWKVCCALGDYYFNKRDYFYAVNYYFEACEVIKSLSMQLPDEFIWKFIKSNGILKPFNKLTTMRKFQDYNKIFDISNEDTGISDDQLENLFDYEQFGDILNNKYFIKSAKKIYNSYMPKGIRNAMDIVKNLYADPIKNLDIIAKYLASITLATKSLIIIDEYDQSYHTIASNDGSNNIPASKYIFEKVRAVREPIMINENSLDNSLEIGLLPRDTKAVICVPIIMNLDEDTSYQKNNKRRTNYFNNPIKGYIYLETERILNNFNKEGLKKCKELSRLAGAQIERYELQLSSSTDKLTGTLTRKFLEDMLTEHIDRSDDIKSFFSIIMMDLDHFKQINDRFGHQTGDDVLGRVCKIIKNNLRKDDLCGRYGGEEFIIILPETDVNGAYIVAEKLRKEIEYAKILGEMSSVTVSMGISTYPYHAQWKQELVEKADQALYISKELGRNQCTVWSNEFSNKVKGTNKLTGIVSGNIVQDSRNVLVMLDVVELIKNDLSIKEKIYNLLGRVIEITESQFGFFFIVEDEKIKEGFARKIFEEDWIEINNYNIDIVHSVIKNKQGIYITDWDETSNYDSVTGVPDWHSVAVVPLIKNGQVNGVLYLSVSTKLKEFKFDEFNFISTLGELSAAIL